MKAWPHPESEKLYCEEIDVGEENVRTIASGLQPYYSVDEMQNRNILVVCNLKPSKMAGFVSQGMVLCAKDGQGTVEFVNPPEGSKPGDIITVEGTPVGKYGPFVPNQVKKKKIWECVAEKLKSNGDRVACWDNIPLVDERGVACIAPTVANGPIS